MWPELRCLDLETNQKLMVCKFLEPEERSSLENSSSWHNGSYLSPKADLAIIEAMDDEAFHSDGAQGQTRYYVYRLPELADVPRNISRETNLKQTNLKPIKVLTKSQLAQDYPEVKPPTSGSNAEVTSHQNTVSAETVSAAKQQGDGVSIPAEFIGTWDSRPMSEESQVVISKKEIRFYLGETVGKFTKVTRTGPNQVVCDITCKEMEDTWNDKTTLTLLAGGKQLRVNDSNIPLYRAK
jgi:hypothetical protein